VKNEENRSKWNRYMRKIFNNNKLGGNMTEYIKDLTSLIKDSNSAIVISDEQIDETGKIVREPVLVFSVEGEKMGYVHVLELKKWINYHMYASSFLEKITIFETVKVA
jgi:hypothetical protein